MQLFHDYVFTGNLVEGRRELLILQPQQDRVLGVTVTVPKGSFSDGASTPKFADDMFGFDPLKELYLRPAVFHDYLYRGQIMPRWKADCVFLAMILNMPRAKYKTLWFGLIMFTAVRLCGKKAYESSNPER